MSPIQLSALERAWANLGQPLDTTLADGLSPSLVLSSLGEVTSAPPGDIVAWFSWCNGGITRPIVQMAPSRFDFLSLEQSLFVYRQRMQMAAEHAQEYGRPAELYWKPTWLPIGDDRGGGALAVDMRSRDGINTGGIHTIDWEDVEDSHVERASSLSAMVDIWLTALRLGLWFWDAATQSWDANHDSVPEELYSTDLVE